jgi:hypothetical protein
MSDKARLLKSYCTGVEHPEAPGIEHDHMLYVRDGLYELREHLTDQERSLLEAADRRLVEQAPAFLAELSRFVDLAQRRQGHNISPERWWWYLDVLAQLPKPPPTQVPAERPRTTAP